VAEPVVAGGDPVLRFTQAGVGYGGRAVLAGVTFDLPAGRTVALVGPNGGGKSTLIRSVLGMADVVDGEVTVLGGAPGRVLGQIAYVPQLDTLDADFPVSAAHVVLMGRYRRIGWWRPTRAIDRRIAAEALARVGLADRAGDRFGLLSGGQRQRVLVARALAAQPRLLLLDEPFNGVDAVNQQAVLRIFAELVADGTAVLVSTHDLAVARQLADVVCLLNGRQHAAGPPADTLTPDLLRQTYASQAIDLGDGRTVLVQP
jgi:manganese/iron transport system ATP-binding protein